VAQLLMVRHGRASLGTADYDVLSDLGVEQSRVAGASLAAQKTQPDLVVRGQMRRHEQTVAALFDGLGQPAPVRIDPGWDEFDFEEVLDVARRATLFADGTDGQPEPRDAAAAFQRAFEQATVRWCSGDFDGDYVESFPAFRARVAGVLVRSQALLDEHRAVLVVSSGGPIAMVAALLVAGPDVTGAQLARIWTCLNRVSVNTGITKLIYGRSGIALSTFNDHHHLQATPGLLTYR